MAVTGPDFIALQVRDLERAATFYEERSACAVLRSARPTPWCSPRRPSRSRCGTPLAGVDLDAGPGVGVVLWLHSIDAQALHDSLDAAGVPILAPPFDGPFGRTFTFADPDGYAVTIHDER